MRVSALVAVVFLAGCDLVFGLAEREPPTVQDASTANLIRWYKMDGLEGGRLVDAAASGHDGLCAPPACPTVATGVVDGALRFDGMTQLVRSASDAALEGPGPFTVALWAYAEDTTNFACVVSKLLGTGVYNSWALCRDASGRWDFVTRTEELWVPEPTLQGGWHHLAIRWDGMTKSISVDGVDKVESPGTMTSDGGDLVIGGDVDDGVPSIIFPGVIDDLRIYNRALSDEELTELAAR